MAILQLAQVSSLTTCARLKHIMIMSAILAQENKRIPNQGAEILEQ